MPPPPHAKSPARNATRFANRRRITQFFLLMLLGFNAVASELNVPYIGEPADRSLSPIEETLLGREVMRQLLASAYVLEDPQVTDYIVSLGERLLRQTNTQEQKFRFFVVKDSAINAFALPGGYIGINAGLIVASSNESELAAVMAHEIAHVTQRHIARSMDKTRGWDLASTALVIAALIAGVHDPEMAQAALTLGMSAAIQQQINFTRANELEADRLGIRTLESAGLDPQGMASFFHRLSQKAQLYGEGVPELLRTHPVNTTRIAEAQARAGAPRQNAAPSSNAYLLMKTRAQILMTELSSEALGYYRAIGKNQPGLSSEYGLALALIRGRAFGEAEQVLTRLLQAYPEELNLQLSLGELYSAAGQEKKAIALLTETRKRHPRSRPATLALATTLLHAGEAGRARQLLLESDLLLARDAESFRLLAMAARDMGEPAEAHFQMAAYSHSRGDYVDAIRQLRNGLALEKLSAHDRQRLQGRIEQYLEQAPDSERKRARQPPSRQR